MRPSRRVRNGFGYAPQGQRCFPQMTTMENLHLVSTVNSEIDEVLDTAVPVNDHLVLASLGADGVDDEVLARRNLARRVVATYKTTLVS